MTAALCLAPLFTVQLRSQKAGVELLLFLIGSPGQFGHHGKGLAQVIAVQPQSCCRTFAQHIIDKRFHDAALAADTLGITHVRGLLCTLTLGLLGLFQLCLCLLQPLDIVGVQAGKRKFLIKDLHGRLLSKKPSPVRTRARSYGQDQPAAAVE